MNTKVKADCGKQHPQRYCKCAACVAARPVVKLNKEFLAAVEAPIHRTWQAIGGDVGALEGRQTFIGNMEMCIDADRLDMYGGGYGSKLTEPNEGKAANDLIGYACMQHDYIKVLKFLARHIKLWA